MAQKFPGLSNPAILSPMAGVTDVAFRALCKRYGAGMTCTEFVSSAALVRDSKRTWAMLVTDPNERPVGVQLFGANEEEVVRAAQLVEKTFDVIDMNCGCPAWKVIKTGAGAALLNDAEKIGRLVERVVDAVKKPVTIKIRSGIDEHHLTAVQVAKAAEQAGAAAIAVHGRTQTQGYAGVADWGVVKAVKDAVTIPVIGNGDVFTAKEFWEKKAASGCDYVMVARGAIGNPRIFRDIIAYNNGAAGPGRRNGTGVDIFLEYDALAQRYGVPFGQVKGHAISFTRGMPGGSQLRARLSKAGSAEELRRLVENVPETI